jgi:hypothetical protein
VERVSKGEPSSLLFLIVGDEGKKFIALTPVVARKAVLAATLHVEGGEVKAKVLARLLEKVVGDFLGDGVVVGLSNLG